MKGIAPRRPPRRVDRPAQPAADDRRATTAASTSRRDGGETWYAPPLPIVAVLPRRRRRRACRTTSWARCRTSARRRARATACASNGHHARRLARRRRRRGRPLRRPTRRDPNVVYAGEYLGIITRYDQRTRPGAQHLPLAREPVGPRRRGPARTASSGRRRSPLSPHDPSVVYHGGNVLFRTRDGGQTWTAISPDLTRNDKAKQKWSGGPITGDNTGVEILRHDLRDRRVAAREGPALGGQRRRPRARHARRRQDVDERDRERAGPRRVGHGGLIEPSRFDAGRRVRRRRRATARRHAALPVEDRPTTAGRGRASPPAAAAGRLPARRARGPDDAAGCSSPAPSAASSSRPTTARAGAAAAEPADRGGARPAW